MSKAMQVSPSNPMVGLTGRTELLIHLATALTSNPQFFGSDARPGNLLGKSAAPGGGGFMASVLLPHVRVHPTRINVDVQITSRHRPPRTVRPDVSLFPPSGLSSSTASPTSGRPDSRWAVSHSEMSGPAQHSSPKTKRHLK